MPYPRCPIDHKDTVSSVSRVQEKTNWRQFAKDWPYFCKECNKVFNDKKQFNII